MPKDNALAGLSKTPHLSDMDTAGLSFAEMLDLIVSSRRAEQDDEEGALSYDDPLINDGILIGEDDLHDHVDLNDSADAKPSHAGGGKGGGKGKNKDTTPDETDGTTDPDPTPDPDPAPDPEPDPTPDPDPAPEPTPEDFGWLDDRNFISGGDTPDGFNLHLEFHGTWTDAQKAIAVDQAELLSDLITGDVAAYNGIDDVKIQMHMTGIDGSGSVWGNAGWISLRPDGSVAEGGVRIDEADINTAMNQNMADELMLHEMLHAIGLGTTWTKQGLVESNKFIGENALSVYQAEYDADATGIPLDSTGGHWSESALGSEQGTTYISGNEAISDLTLAALEDMGYETVWGEDDMLFV